MDKAHAPEYFRHTRYTAPTTFSAPMLVPNPDNPHELVARRVAISGVEESRNPARAPPPR
jgi:hypothetical protein